MASHKQSFQCFDTITDDPPVKPPFPHGHCSSTSLRGSSGTTRLEPLESRGCYLCADHQAAKTTASEASGAYSSPWYHSQTLPHAQQYSSRRPARPEESSGQAEDHHRHHHHHHHHRSPRKIVLVKNSDPSMRRTIVLHRRSLRSLALFMDEVSELMQCLIRKLYTLEGHKIDSVQSLLQCPGVLVCVGREPFHPLLLDSFRKHSYDKLPRLNTKSRSSVCSDEKAAKKNVNFGLETKRSVIHPRCDSSNRSARLSASSEKLFPNRLDSLPPGDRGDCVHAGENMMDDDIEKRVLVNKDGSLSMEMKVRFRLLHNETLHWSTEVKKSKSTFNDSHLVSDDACSVSHGSSESCSEADSLSAGEANETYHTKRYQRHFEESHCQHCCARCQEYDIWKNPVPPSQGAVRRIRSSSSSASSRRIVCKKASTDSIRTVSSEEYTEHVVEKATCIQQTFGQQVDTTIEQCTINHCCSRSEVSSISPKPKSTSTVDDRCENIHASDNEENRPDVISSNLPKDHLSVQITQQVEEDERSISVLSSSSQILASLKEDQDDDVNPTISRASHDQQDDEESKDPETNQCSASPCKSPASLRHLSPRPPSKASSSGRSKTYRKFASPEVGTEEVRSEASASPNILSGPKTCKCVVTKDTPEASETNDEVEDMQVSVTEERALSATSTKSLSELSTSCENGNPAEIIPEKRSLSALSIKSNNSRKSVKTNVLDYDERALSATSNKSQRVSGDVCEEENLEVRKSSAMSVNSNISVRSRVSDHGIGELGKLQDNVEKRAVSVASSRSNISTHGAFEEGIEEKALSVKSGTSNKSGIEELTHDDPTEERASRPVSIISNISARSKTSFELSETEDYNQDRAPSSVSLKSNVSHKTKSEMSEEISFHEEEESLNSINTSVELNKPEDKGAHQVELHVERSPSSASSKSNISTISRASQFSEVNQDEILEKEDDQERASSAISVKSSVSARSRKSETTPILRSGDKIKDRAPSAMSLKSNASLTSNKSKIENEETENRASSALSVKSEASTLSKKLDIEQLEERASSALSAKSNSSKRSKRSKMSEVGGDDDRSSAVHAASRTSETAPKETCESSDKSPEERGPSALSTKSNTSVKSKKSNVSNMTADSNMDKNRDDLRSASAMSSKSDISAKSEFITEDQVETIDHAEKRAQSALSARSNQSGVIVSEEVEVAEERALSAMSSKSNASGRSNKSKTLKVPTASPQRAERQLDERAQSALLEKSSISARSKKSKLSDVLTDELVDAKYQEEERASSALSARSNISAISMKSNASMTDVNTDDNEQGDRVASAASVTSDISTKTSISAKSKASKVLQVEPEEPDDKEEIMNIDRSPSAISVISEASPDENKVTNEGEIQERASSALSANSNISAKSKMSNASAIDGNTDVEEILDRVSSAMSGRYDISTKTSMSAKSKASKVSEVKAEEPDDEDNEVKAPSITKSCISVRSNKTKNSVKEEGQNPDRSPSASSVISDATPDENEDRASSALSAKSNISAKSKKSNATDVEIDDKEKENRVSSAMSGRSAISTKTSVSAKSKASKVSEIQPEEVHNLDRSPSAISVISEASPEENKATNEGEIQERAPSALSAKSNISVRSSKSKVSEIIINEPEEQKSDRAPSSRSLKSEVSGRSGHWPDIEKKDKEVRSESALSTVSNRSTRTDKSEQSDLINNIVQKAPSTASVTSKTSARSKRSNISGVGPQDTKNIGDVRSSSGMSAKSGTSERTAKEDEEANALVERTTSSLSVKSCPSTCTVSKDGVDKKAKRSMSKLSVKSNMSSRSKKSKVSEVEDLTLTNSVKTPVSDHSEVSKPEKNNKCVCGTLNKSASPIVLSERDSDYEEVPVSPLSKKSGKSQISSAGSASERVLTPSSTSVSIGIFDDHEADDGEEIDVVSVKSRTSEVCGDSEQCLSDSPVRIANEAIPASEERTKSFASANSNISSKSKSKCSHCSSACHTDTNQDINGIASNTSSKTKYLITSPDGQLSAKIRPSSKASGMSAHTEVTSQERTESPDVTHKPQSICSKCSSTQQKSKMSPVSSASAISHSGISKTKEEHTAEINDRPKSNISSSSSQVNSQNNNAEATVISGRSDKLSTKSRQKVEDSVPRCHSATLSLTSGNQLSPIPPKSPKKSKKPVILLGGSNGSAVSQSGPAKDPRQEQNDHLNAVAAVEKPRSCTSNNNMSDIKSEKSSKCRKRMGSDSSCHKMDDDMSELSPSFLPNASPTEVVNEWLRKIPLDTALCDLADDFHEKCESTEPLCTSNMPMGDEIDRERLQGSDATKLETKNKIGDDHVLNAEEIVDDKSPETVEDDLSQREDKPKVFNSSVLVMKVLLSPKLDRCNSLPEVSPVYGRKLSASAQGLLDCLANLQLLDFGPCDEDGKKEKYQELMSMLKSLWLCDPKNKKETSEEKGKHLDEELKARSSSGVDVNSGSTGSGKSSVNDGTQVQPNTDCEGLDTLTKVQEVEETVEEETSKTPESKNDSATPDVANQTQMTPDKNVEKLKDDVPGSDETIRSYDSPRELIETPLSSNKSSGNNPKTEEPQSDHQEDTSSGSAPTLQRGQLSKKISQDPDPVWVLNLLNKLEKQFMTHYVDAMAEFKVRWNLDENEQLDTMISELQDEVQRRIQYSIDKELKKIHGRAGRPKPPKETISRESTIQTEQRRRRLKVMRNQSIDPQPAKSDDDYTMTGTDFSDQRSDDEYCPCESCLKKKMASKPVLPVEILNSAPVMMDFDLRKILQIKKSSPANEKIEENASTSTSSKMEEENVGLEAVKEEEEKEGGEIIFSGIQEIRERKSEEGDEEDNASSTYVEDSSEKQSNAPSQLRAVVDDDDDDDDGEIDKLSYDSMTAQHQAAEQDEDQEEDGIDSAGQDKITEDETGELSEKDNDDIAEVSEKAESETAEDRQPAKDETDEGDSVIDTAEENEAAESESADGQTAEDKIKQDKQTDEDQATVDGESVEEKTSDGGQAAEDKTSKDGQTADDETAEDEHIIEDETAEEIEKFEDKSSDDGQSAEDKTSEDGQTADEETAEDKHFTEDETAEEIENFEVKTSDDGQNAEDKTSDDGQTAEDKTSEDGQTADEETAEDKHFTEDETAEEIENFEVKTSDDGQNAEDKTSDDGQTAEDKTSEDGQTAEDETAEDGKITEDEKAEEIKNFEDKTSEDGQTVEDKTSDDGQTAEDKTSEDGQTADEDTAEDEHLTVDEETAEEIEKFEDQTSHDGQTAEGETAKESETVEDETAEGVHTAEGETAEKCETPENQTLEDGQIAEDEIADQGESVNGDTAEDQEMAENKTVEDQETAEDETTDDKTTEDGQTAEDKTSEDGQTAEDKTSEDGQTAEDETADDKTSDDGQSAEDGDAEDIQTTEDDAALKGATVEDKIYENKIAIKDETTEDGTADECETSSKIESVEDEEIAEAESVEESNRSNDETAENGETANNNNNNNAEDTQTDEADTAEESDTGYEDTTKDSETAEDETAEGTSAEERGTEEQRADDDDETGENTDDVDNTGDVSAEEKETSEAESEDEGTTNAESEMHEGKATEDGSTEQDENAEIEPSEQTPDHETTAEDTDRSQTEGEDEDTVSCEAADVLSNIEDTESQDVSTNLEVVDGDEESDKEENDLAKKAGLVFNNGESAEAGDEAEDETEPDMETDEGERDGNTPNLQPMLQPKQKDGKPDGAASLNVLINHNSESEDGAYADGEDSETEEHSQVIDLNSESENKPQRKTAFKTFKLLVNTLNFLKVAGSGQPKKDEDDNEDEDQETPEDGSDNAEESSCVEKDEVEELNQKEKGKLSDITEDTGEEGNQTNDTNDGSEDSELENALQKQITKSSLESQPGSFEEVHEEPTKKQMGSNHLQTNFGFQPILPQHQKKPK
nr:uncharacterized protein rp1l1b isoform X2 [Danio rerio]|eukprot:XP_021324285.1 uncharacterized protein rp1l1b isoform X2 [Danio rerio]